MNFFRGEYFFDSLYRYGEWCYGVVDFYEMVYVKLCCWFDRDVIWGEWYGKVFCCGYLFWVGGVDKVYFC